MIEIRLGVFRVVPGVEVGAEVYEDGKTSLEA